MDFYKQYLQVKKQNPDALVFYRIGDFYELFGQDAITASKILDLTLTSRDVGLNERIPMCGIPYHSADSYIAKLLKEGYKTAVCEQPKTETDFKDKPRITINLSAVNMEQKVLKEYLEDNASQALADKINNGVKIIKDGKTLINKKDISTFMEYAYKEAQSEAEKGAKFACVDYKVVFNWLIHYFEEDSIEGKLYNDDGTEFKPVKPVALAKNNSVAIAPPKPKKELSLFDLIDIKKDEPVITAPKTEEALNVKEVTPKPDWIDNDGIVIKDGQKNSELTALLNIFGNTLIVR